MASMRRVGFRALLTLAVLATVAFLFAVSMDDALGIATLAATSFATTIWPPAALRRQTGGTPRIVALYFPQFHEFELNNRLWGKGFTDYAGVVASGDGPHGVPVARPVGLDDIRLVETRRRHGAQAAFAGVDAFAFYHYWFNGTVTMDAPLEAMLRDGEPSTVQHMLVWANEPWTRNWDGGNRDVLVEQVYPATSSDGWRQHFNWLLRFWQHPRALLRDGKPVFGIYRPASIPDLEVKLAAWRAWSIEAGLAGLYVIQCNGGAWGGKGKAAYRLNPGVDGAYEFWPSLEFQQIYDNAAAEVLGGQLLADSDIPLAQYSFGAGLLWNNKPRHRSDGRAWVNLMHPSVFQYRLGVNLRRSVRDGMIFVNAFNEHGEGPAMEPTIEWGDAWLRATRNAKAAFADGRPAIAIPPAGLPALAAMAPAAARGVCIIVRATAEHVPQRGRVVSLGDTLASLADLRGSAPGELSVQVSVVEGAPDAVVSALSNVTREAASSSMGSTIIHATTSRDSAIATLAGTPCGRAAPAAWIMLAPGNALYAPDALAALQPSADVVVMNAFSGRAFTRSLVTTHARPGSCCSRLAAPGASCVPSAGVSLDSGDLEPGTVLVRRARIAELEASGQAAEAMGELASKPTAFLRRAVAAGWRVAYHDVDKCAMYASPSAPACALAGGVYVDVADAAVAGCYDLNLLPAGMPRDKVDWNKFMTSEIACACPRQ